ncbi:PAS domain S-box protein [Natrarchaeobius chitinivorans]|uniref:histidine kinase n=1 Tax=Natrarchaeobius chitinivorans TaxID=1679083 RepID=A0A3N6P9V8_NATCH|nr:PAS domain S-box protein [Natrarchaeobius chitinivorans]RQG95779.1 PAS domain S-box protein [Natrarchaeobius chitinivorans]
MSNRPESPGSGFWKEGDDAAARRRFQAFVNTIDDGLYQLDPDRQFVAVNDVLCETTGYTREELVGSHVSLLVNEADIDRIEREVRTQPATDGTDVPTFSLTVERSDGDRVPCELRVNVLEEAGEFDGTIGVVRDVSDHARRQEPTSSARETYEAITSVLNEANIGVFVLDDELTVAFADETIEEYFGIDRDALIGRDKRRALDGIKTRIADSETFEETVQATYDDNSYIERFECRVTADEASGRAQRWLEHWSKPIESGRYAGGRVEFYYDITDRKRSKGALEQSEAEFASLVDAVEEYAIFRLDTNGHVVSWNEGAKKIKGYDREEILGEHFSTFYTDADRAGTVPEENLRKAAEADYVEDEGWRVRNDGTWFWANVTITAIRDDDGTLQGYAKVTRDMTDRREREQRLQEERDLVTQILETSPIGITVVNPDGSTERANQRMAEILGFSKEAMGSYTAGQLDMYDSNGEFLPTEERPASRALETGEPVTNAEIRINAPNGQSRWLSINAAPVIGDDEDIRHVVVAAADITQLKIQAERLERQRDDLRTELDEMFERIDDAFYAVDTDWQLTYVNDALADLVGTPRKELVGMNLWEVFPELADTEFAEFDREAMETGETIEYELYYEPKDAWFQVAVYPSETGQSVYLKDITERKEARTRLQRRARQQETVAQLGQLALKTDDLDELMAAASRRIADVLDIEYCTVLDLDQQADELSFRQGVGWRDGTIGEATVAATDDSQAGYTLISEEPVVVDDFDTETRFSGSELLASHDVRSAISTIIGPDDEPWGILGLHDVDNREFTEEDVNFVQSVANILAEAIERTEYQTELEATIERLEESNERLEQFAYAASHDLQEPLRMVSSYLQLIDQRYGDELDEDGQEFLEFAVDGADRMRNMVQGLLTYSRVDTQGDPLEPIDAEEAVEDAIADLEVKIAETDAEITVESLPSVQADPDQLRQVFQNLIANALSYSGDEPPRVHVSAERAGPKWLISVTDKGIGIAPEDQERIFDVFNQGHSREEDTGTGIGLAICQRIVERHDGDIWVESEPGSETTFSFTLSGVPAGES